jgi:hypothetical protein
LNPAGKDRGDAGKPSLKPGADSPKPEGKDGCEDDGTADLR